MTQLTEQTRLPNGIRVITETMPQVRTAALGVWIGAGSRYERPEVHGISHFLEHLLFKGTTSRTALDIAQQVDAVGGQMNAFTDKELTCLYVRVLADHLPVVMEIMADMLLRSAFDPQAIERERQVILEEIKSYEDSPDELVQDLFAQTIWNGHPLGRPVIGTVETVRRLDRDAFLAYVGERYRPDNVVVAAAGDVLHAGVVRLVEETLGDWQGSAVPVAPEAPGTDPAIVVRAKATEQVHLALGAPALPQAHERRYVLSVLDNLLGGGMSSRLFQEIREKRGLVYTITSYVAAYREGGLFVIYGAMSPETAPQVTRLVLEEIEKVKDAVPADELRRARESLKGAVMLGLESTGSRMGKLARSELYYGRQISLDEILAQIDAVTAEDVQAMARELLVPERMAMAAIGPFRTDGRLEGELREALRPGAAVA